MKNGSEIIVEPAAKSWRKIALICAMTGVLLLFIVTVIYLWKRQQTGSRSQAGSSTSITARGSAYGRAVRQVEEDRGEPTGNKAKIDVPAELKLYTDRNRFLAIQVAESLEQKYEIPLDFAGLVPMIERGDFQRLPALGNAYILYGVGLKANDELTHFDEKSGKSIQLFAGDAEREAELKRLSDSLKELDEKTQELKKDLSKLPRSDKSASRDLQNQISAAQKSADEIKKRRELIDDFYKTEENRRLAYEEYGKLSGLAGNFDNRSYDLNDAAARKEFKVSLLSMLRPAARARLEETRRR